MHIFNQYEEFDFSSKRRTLRAAPIVLKEADRRLLRAIHALRVVDIRQVVRLFGVSPSYARERLARLYDNAFLEIVPRPYAPKELVYRLGPEGARVLAGEVGASLGSFRYWGKGDDKDRRKTEVSPYFIEHTLQLTDIRIAFQQSAEVNGFTIEEWLDESDLKRADKRIRVELATGRGGELQHVTLYPDGYFVLRTPQGRGYFFIEADRATESVSRRWRYKVLAYKEFVRSRAFHEAYGHESAATPLRILTTTPSQARAENLKEAAERFGPPELSKMFLFTSLSEVLKNDALTSSMWGRAGTPLTDAVALASVGV